MSAHIAPSTQSTQRLPTTDVAAQELSTVRGARIAVVGGGISGLAAALDLAGAGAHVTVYESRPLLGRALRTTEFDGLPVEEGADAFLVRLAEAVDLAARVGAELVHPASGQAWVYAAGAMRALPAGTVLGVPGDLTTLRGVISPTGRARAALDRWLPTSRLDADPSVGALVRARLGAQVLDRLVDPLLGGVYAGAADGLSVAMTAPVLRDPQRSLMATVTARRPAPTGGPVFGSVVGGLGSFVAATADRLIAAGGQIETGQAVTALEQTGPGWTLLLGPAGRQRRIAADAVVLAVPAGAGARLLTGMVPTGRLPDTAYASVAIVTLSYAPGTALPSGSGILIAPSAGRTVKAATFVGQKWSHPDDAPVIVRTSIGRFGQEADLQRPDDELAGVAAAELATIAGIRGRPRASRVSRWGGALPQYAPGHLDRVAALRAALPTGLRLAGAAYDGVGIPVCIRSGQTAARELAASLSAGPRSTGAGVGGE